MRVAILANVPVWTLPGLKDLKHGGHYATWLESLIPELKHLAPEFDIHWITMCKEVDREIVHEAFGQTFHILPRGRMSISMVTGYVAEIHRIRKVLSKLKPTVVHAWGSEDVYGLAGAFSGIENRIFTLQGSLTEYVRLIGGPFLFRLQAMYERPTVRRYRQGTGESPGAAELLKQLNPDLNIRLLDYGVSPDFFAAEWKPSESPEVAYLGGLSKRKGVADLLQVAARPELAHVRFKMIGEGPLRGEFESTCSPNIEWAGKCDRSGVIEHLSGSWMLVMPTYSDTGPTVIKEARAMGIPVLTTFSAGASSYISDAGCGYVVKAGDQGAMVEAILRGCSSRSECIRLGKAGWEYHKVELHPRTTAEKMRSLYQNLTSTAN